MILNQIILLIKGKSSVIIQNLKVMLKKVIWSTLQPILTVKEKLLAWHLKDALGINDKDYERVVI